MGEREGDKLAVGLVAWGADQLVGGLGVHDASQACHPGQLLAWQGRTEWGMALATAEGVTVMAKGGKV